ncbi:MAG: serine/threonine protein kinase [Deltaproteobacteria bacterium]|nr:serine/threonine protein kinase [Deltaproteobacteria bacterium]
MAAAQAKRCPRCETEYAPDVLFCPKDGRPLHGQSAESVDTPLDPYVGLVLEGRIEIRELLGVGSMGRVYRAFQGGIERDVAVKILRQELSTNEQLVSRFHREARIASRLVHPNVVQLLMSGELPRGVRPGVGGDLYLVMEYLGGITLLSALAAAGGSAGSGALGVERALRIALQICDAVGEAHAKGIVHRDIKPENVMLVQQGEQADFVKVLDFGVARLEWHDRSLWTQAGLVFGSAPYVSPEGAQGETVGPAADVYAIATVLYQCLAGRTPFVSDSPVKLLVQHAQEPPPDIRSEARAAYLHPEIATAIMRNLAKDPAARAADGRLLGAELAAAARRAGLDLQTLLLTGSASLRRPMRLPAAATTQAMDPAVPTAGAGERVSPCAPPVEDAPAPPHEPEPGPAPPPPSPAPARADRRRRARAAAWTVACVLGCAALVPPGLVALRHLDMLPSAPGAELDEQIATAREQMHDRAWDAPEGRNVRDTLSALSRRWPDERRVARLRLEAAERLVADALGLRYEGRVPEALQRVRLAIELAPQLEVAHRLGRELEGSARPAFAPGVAPQPTRLPPRPRPAGAGPWPAAPAPLPAERGP